MTTLINTVTKTPIVRVHPRDFVNPLWAAKPFRDEAFCLAIEAEYQALLPKFVRGKMKFMHLGKRYTLLRTQLWDSDDLIVRYELLVNRREVNVDRLFNAFFDDEDRNLLSGWVELPYKTHDHNAELSAYVAKICSLYRMHPNKQTLLMKYEMG